MKKIFLIFIIFIISVPESVRALEIEKRLSGRILLQIEENGEAWYVSPETYLRHFMGRPDDAFNLMRQQGHGISNVDLARISNDKDFANKHLGKIFLQVEEKGESWYLNPADGELYFLSRPINAFTIMQNLGLGISNSDLAKIIPADNKSASSELESLIHVDVNRERTNNGLSALKWNASLANVARTHSQGLADENMAFTGIGRTCDYPMIHHEDLINGFYNSDRLKNAALYYFSEAGENIALYSAASFKVSYYEGGTIGKELEDCPVERAEIGTSFKAKIDQSDDDNEKRQIINTEIEKRKVLFAATTKIEPKDFQWYENSVLSADITKGWMNSPGHRENILNGDYDEAGIGVIVSNGYVFATQVFIKRAECGFWGGECCTKKGYLPYCFVPLECGEGFCK